jgi:S-adenosylmethionine synthetase
VPLCKAALLYRTAPNGAFFEMRIDMNMLMNTTAVSMSTGRTAEHVSQGHPDKFCDQCADKLLDVALEEAAAAAGDDESSPDHPRHQRLAVEMLAKDRLVVLSGEVKFGPRVLVDVGKVVRQVWSDVGFPMADAVTVVDHLQQQSPDIAQGVNPVANAVSEGAGDQGIMVGYATDETSSFMPLEWDLSQRLCIKIQSLRSGGELPWLGADTKTQVTLSAGKEPVGVIVAAQHADGISPAEVREALMTMAVLPVLGEISPSRVVINGTGRFVIGGTIGDAGVVGRKIVVDAYGPAVPVGGGAYSGKDPTKVDRSAAYMARHVAKAIVANKIGEAHSCLVRIAYGIGQTEPVMVTAMTDSGDDLGPWVRKHFDLSPRAIIDQLGLLRMGPAGKRWSYVKAASFGHYGRDCFPWERVPKMS